MGLRRHARASTTPRSTRRPHARSRSPAPGAAVARGASARSPSRRYVDRYVTPLERDPAGVPLGERVALLLEAERALHGAPTIAVGRAWIDLWRTDKEFYSTIGSRIAQTIYQSGGAISAMAVGDGDVQVRMWPGDRGLYFGGGWEVDRTRRSCAKTRARIGEEAHQLLAAPQCPSGTMDVILGGSQMSLQIHESCGHAAELDRVMGWEANFSGTSFLDPAERGKLRYGSPIVTIEIDNTMPRGLATVGYDDEGTKSVRADVIRDGILVGFESSRDTARAIGAASTSCVRAESWEHVPMIRMCNLNLLPGDVPFEHLFDDVRDGVYMETNRSWSIDDRRLNFQFGCADRLGDQERQARPDAQESDLRRRDAACSGIRATRSATPLVVRVGNAELRQGRTDANRPHDASRRAGALPQRRGRSRLWTLTSAARSPRASSNAPAPTRPK